MAGNANSGRRPVKVEDRKRISRLYPVAVSVLEEILQDPSAPMNLRLDAAKEVVRHQIGTPRQAVDVDTGDKNLTHLLRELAANRKI